MKQLKRQSIIIIQHEQRNFKQAIPGLFNTDFFNHILNVGIYSPVFLITNLINASPHFTSNILHRGISWFFKSTQ